MLNIVSTMSSKNSGSSPAPKRKRTSYNIDVKLDVIHRKQRGERVIDIARVLNIPETTIHTILKRAEEIEAKAEHVLWSSEVKITRQRSDAMEIMENQLATWIEDAQQHAPISLSLIQEKALSLYETIMTELGEDVKAKPFAASRGWFHRFQKRHGFKNVKIMGENANADVDSTGEFPGELQKIIKSGKYLLKQVFNVDETGLYWKRIPSCTYISMKEKTTSGFKASKDRISLLVGGNASGDKKLKPLLVYRSENPQALKNMAKQSLPVIWKSHRKAWITRQIFRDWFVEYFVPEMKKYCEKENMDFKILLIVDSAPAHMLDFESLSENIKVVFMPPSVTGIMQPMDQGVIRALKLYYLWRVFRQFIMETDASDEETVHDFWKNFDILDCVKIIDESWNELSYCEMSGCWKNVLPGAVHSFEGIEFSQIQKEIVDLAKEAGFNEVNEDDVTDWLESHSFPLNNEELAALDQQTLEEAKFDDEEASAVVEEKTLTINGIRELFKKAEEMVNYAKQHDPLYDRSAKFERELNNVLLPYKMVLLTKEQNGKEQH